MNSYSSKNRQQWVVIAIALACVSCSSTAQPGEKPTTTFQAENKERSMAFLNSIKGLIDEPPVTVEKISATFGWSVAREIEGPNGAYTHTSFRSHPQDPGTYPQLSVGKNEIRLSINLISGLDPCVSGDYVLEQFGTNFKSSLSILHPYPDPSMLSDEVKRNSKKFFHGPTYFFKKGSVSTSIIFSFPLTACLATITLTQTPESKTTQ